MKRMCGVLVLCLVAIACDKVPEKDAFDLNGVLGGASDEGFQRAVTPREFHFPQDHTSHSDFRNEWWYITGNLHTNAGRHFGYQVTFFRAALKPSEPVNRSVWATYQVWMAHVALTDIENNQHLHDQRLARGAAGLAGQVDQMGQSNQANQPTEQPFKVWLEDWQIIGSDRGDFPWQVDVKTDEFTLNLHISPEKPVVLQGDKGLSQKSTAAGNASYYYSFTRLKTTGEIYLEQEGGSEKMRVQGDSWLDREWSTSVLGEDQAGWDWFSLQLADKHELMFYRLRKKSGETDQLSAGKWVLAEGNYQPLDFEDVLLKPKRYWESTDGRRYPIVWELRIPDQDKVWEVAALVDDQLMQTGITYWEGAVKVTDVESKALLGYGYLEMSGY